MSELLKIKEFEQSHDFDVVFIHGLGGHPFDTWRSSNSEQKQGFPDMLGAQFPTANVFSLQYDAALSDWSGSSMALVDRALNVLTCLIANHIGKKPLLFICHSLGGLVVKQCIRAANDSNDDKGLSLSIRFLNMLWPWMRNSDKNIS